jgi:hypothetical protein
MSSLLELHGRLFPVVPKARSARPAELSLVYSISYPGHIGREQGHCKEIAQDALTGILDGNFQIKVR